MKCVNLYFLLCVNLFLCAQAQVTFVPDPEETVSLNRTPLAAVEVITVEQYYTAPNITVQYVTTDDKEAVKNISNAVGGPLNGSKTRPIQFRVPLVTLAFIAEPALVGGTFRLRATLDNNTANSTTSNRRYTFPAPFNLTGSSVRAALNSVFTWTCHVTSNYPVIEWFRGDTNLGQLGILNGTCKTFGQINSYTYDCQLSALTYTLTIPGSSLTEELQGTTWRCKDVTDEVKGSKFMKLDIIGKFWV